MGKVAGYRIVKNARTLIDGNDYRGREESEEQFQGKLHGPHYGAKPMQTEDAVSAGLGLSEVIRQARDFGKADDAVLFGLARLIMAQATSPADVLALVTTAHGLSRIAIEVAQGATDADDAATAQNVMLMRAMSAMLEHAISALEGATGIASETFSGGASSIN
ncbi:hypothetical protein [Aquibium microcysteis]|uniref:hypothetical protein n=1 Tax=Aquibium microcysteis TaxID=675281 RepID=UPI00165D2547|nr:hypothetical protein [Aquibium microcysteis]